MITDFSGEDLWLLIVDGGELTLSANQVRVIPQTRVWYNYTTDQKSRQKFTIGVLQFARVRNALMVPPISYIPWELKPGWTLANSLVECALSSCQHKYFHVFVSISMFDLTLSLIRFDSLKQMLNPFWFMTKEIVCIPFFVLKCR